ncbi:HK97 family phage prohead protease [Thalassospira lohafexi]|uniref:HK97 family phage prohead protease n=1 Tax=Thalassospira lohafexi TaxID=744227 RepID=A0A2N3L464_9PROT|nr:HK97 family phage prohead protease [Thalassospira lohafexi]PKR57497.1 HK97 family phage prohead protease [Thalassospira lohafexi]
MNETLLRDGPEPSELELRFNLETELRADDDTARKVTGYAALFNSKTKIRMYGGYSFEEWLNPGCFGNSIGDKTDIRFLVEHMHFMLLARTAAGSLDLSEDKRGLKFEAVLPDTTLGRDTYENIRNKNYPGMSFGFRSVKNRTEYDDRGRLTRVQHDEVDLKEITVTSIPAYPKTSVAVRSLAIRPAPDNLALRARLLKLKG